MPLKTGSNTVRVYEPVAGMLAGAAVLGIRQIQYDAENQEQSANSILQLNTVEPLQMVTGDLVLKNCCDPYPTANDVIRLEVTASDKTSAFEFVRTQTKKQEKNAGKRGPRAGLSFPPPCATPCAARDGWRRETASAEPDAPSHNEFAP